MSDVEMTTAELEDEVNRAYGRYMYYEAADRGYDYEASRKAFSRYLDLKAELEKRNQEITL